MRFFTADHHFGHKNVIEYDGRPFDSLDHMETELIRRWNQVIKPTDVVYYLGDFSFYGVQDSKKLLDKLHGTKVLLIGNHDKSPTQMLRCGFSAVFDYGKISIDGLSVSMNHDPKDGDNFGIHLHGHVHHAWKTKKNWEQTGNLPHIWINVGVPVWDYYPVSEKQIVKLIRARKCV